MPELTRNVIANEFEHLLFIGLNFPNYTKERMIELIGYNVSMYPFVDGETETTRKAMIDKVVTELAKNRGYKFAS